MKVLGQITDEHEILLRQVNPSLVRAGRPTAKIFEPKPRDENQLSVTQQRLRDAATAHAEFTKNPKCKSVGVLAVTVGDCSRESLPAHEAPMIMAEDGFDDPTHAIIDFRAFGPDQIEEKAIALLRAAQARGFIFRPAA